MQSAEQFPSISQKEKILEKPGAEDFIKMILGRLVLQKEMGQPSNFHSAYHWACKSARNSNLLFTRGFSEKDLLSFEIIFQEILIEKNMLSSIETAPEPTTMTKSYRGNPYMERSVPPGDRE